MSLSFDPSISKASALPLSLLSRKFMPSPSKCGTLMRQSIWLAANPESASIHMLPNGLKAFIIRGCLLNPVGQTSALSKQVRDNHRKDNYVQNVGHCGTFYFKLRLWLVNEVAHGPVPLGQAEKIWIVSPRFQSL